MKLKKYLEKNDLSVRQFGKIVGISYSAICLYSNGKRTPRLDIALKIEKATKGIVTIKDLCQ